jgi:hypothetical protein
MSNLLPLFVAVGDEVNEVEVDIEVEFPLLTESLLWTNARAAAPYSFGYP